MKFIISLCIFVTILVSCSPEPRAIEFGKDKCVHCEMLIVENKWGAELVSDKGKLYFFDSIECLITYIKREDQKDLKVFSGWTVNYENPGELIDYKKAYYLQSPQLHSPMGLNVASFKSEADRLKYESFENAKKLNYDDVVDLVKIGW
jgi:copper chaperone NosL